MEVSQAILSDLSKVIVTQQQIEHRIQELGQEITSTYQALNIDEITIICITNGSVIFAADLLRQIQMHTKLDCVRVCSYRDEKDPSITETEIIDTIRLDIEYQDVLLIDDVLDTGRTILKISDILKSSGPASFRSCVLLDKQGRRQVDYKADFTGFEIPDEFVVGYGLDFAERYRNLPCIGVLKPELQNPPEWQ